MREDAGLVASHSIEVEPPRLDLSGGETQDGLLSRLRNQNSALEKLRRALDADDDDLTFPETGATRERA